LCIAVKPLELVTNKSDWTVTSAKLQYYPPYKNSKKQNLCIKTEQNLYLIPQGSEILCVPLQFLVSGQLPHQREKAATVRSAGSGRAPRSSAGRAPPAT
jgi:hypothetical protein